MDPFVRVWLLELLDTGDWSDPTRAEIEARGGVAYLQAGLRQARLPRPSMRPPLQTLEDFVVAFGTTYRLLEPKLPQPDKDGLSKNSLYVLARLQDCQRLAALPATEADYAQSWLKCLSRRELEIASLLEPYLRWTNQWLLIQTAKVLLRAPAVGSQAKSRVESNSMADLELYRELVVEKLLVGANQYYITYPLLRLAAWHNQSHYLRCLLAKVSPAMIKEGVSSLLREKHQLQRRLPKPTWKLLLSLLEQGRLPASILMAHVTTLKEARQIVARMPETTLGPELTKALPGLYERSTPECLQFLGAQAVEQGCSSEPISPVQAARCALVGGNLQMARYVMSQWPQLNFDRSIYAGYKWTPSQVQVRNAYIESGLNMWRQLLPLMQELAQQQPLPSLKAMAELELLTAQARFSLVSLLGDLPLELEWELMHGAATPALSTSRVLAWYRMAAATGPNQILLLAVLGFVDFYSQLTGLQLLEVVRHCSSYDETWRLRALLDSIPAEDPRWVGCLDTAFGYSISYRRLDHLEWLLSVPVFRAQLRPFFLEKARHLGNLDIVACMKAGLGNG